MTNSPKVRFVNRDRTRFFPTVKSRVDQYFNNNSLSKHANSAMILKTMVMLSFYIIPFIIIVLAQPPYFLALLLWMVMGLGVAGIGMSVMHDANHGAYSNNKLVNYLMGHVLNLLGGSVYNWKNQHNLLHHTYTNIQNMDEDMDGKAMLRFAPHGKVKKMHRFQWFYAFALYSIATLYWVVAKDFVQFFSHIKKGVNNGTPTENLWRLTRIIIVKILYFGTIIVLPVMLGLSLLQVITGFVIMHMVAGLVLTSTFQLAHIVEGTSYPQPDEDGNIENEWAIHQMNTTANFARNSKLLSWYVGGLNFQVEHHLFPTISHMHYPAISSIVKETAEEFGIPYLENPSLADAFRSHVRALKEFGKLPDLNEVMG